MTSEYDGENRPLPWDLLHPLVGHQTVEEDVDCVPSSFVWPEDPNERTLVPFSLSLNEWNILGSAIDVGADIAFGDKALRVNWLWMRNMRCEVSICAAVLNCIETNEDVRNAIVGLIETSPTIYQLIQQISSQNTLAPETLNTNILKPDECGLGYLYSQAVTVVQTLHTMTINVFNDVSTGLTPAQWASLFIAIYPIAMNAFTAGFVLGMVSALVGAVAAAYNAQWDDPFIDELTCDVFCLLQEDCSLTINELAEFYIARSGLSLSSDPYQAFLDVLFIISNGTWTGHAVELMHLLQVTAMRLNINILGIDYGQYAIVITASGDIEDNGYLTECDECPEEVCFDFTTSAHGFYAGDENGNPTSAFGVYILGEGLAPNQTTGGFNWGVAAGDITVGNVQALTLFFNQEIDELYLARWASDDFQVFSGPASNMVTFSALNTTAYFPFDTLLQSIRFTTGSNIAPIDLRVTQICYLTAP